VVGGERVDQVPLGEVFDWKRLRNQGLLVLALTVVFYLLVGGGFSIARAVQNQGRTLSGFSDLGDVSTIWFERNVLLHNTIWPRRSHLEIIDFPDELRIPKESTPPQLRVRAWKYVLADSSAPEGWRLLTWQDLSDRPDLVGADLPDVPGKWTPRDADLGLTVDEVELQLNRFEIRQTLPDKELPAKWNIASAQEESGWRPLQWADLTADKVGAPVPALSGNWDRNKALPVLTLGSMGLLGGGTGALGVGARTTLGPKYISLSVDEVETRISEMEKLVSEMEKQQKKEKVKGRAREIARVKEEITQVKEVFARLGHLLELRGIMDKIDERASDPKLRRTMRKLIVPATLTLTFKSRSSTNQNTMQRVAGNEFTGSFGELKESVTFTVRGEDYITTRRTITVVELPRLERLLSEEERPAYLYYRPLPDGDARQLRGKKQKFQPTSIPVQGGDTSLVEVPAGTSLLLTATANKPLQEVTLIPVKGSKVTASKPEILDTDDKSFIIRIDDLKQEQRFTVQFRDTDNVLGKRTLVILPKEDVAPRIREFAPDEVIRRTKEGYMITPLARIPFKGKVLDDRGLARVRYAYTVARSDFVSAQKLQWIQLVGGLGLAAPGTHTRLQSLAYATYLDYRISKIAEEEKRTTYYLDLPAFHQTLKFNKDPQGRDEFLGMETIERLLSEPQRDPFRMLVREFSIQPDNWTEGEDITEVRRWAKPQARPLGYDLPLWSVRHDGQPLKEPNLDKPQKRYVVEVWLEAEDTYLEGEVDRDGRPKPNVTPSGEKFTFHVVPENELLSKVAEEEDIKYQELQKAFNPLRLNQDKLFSVGVDLAPSMPQSLVTAAIARLDSIEEVLRNSQQETKAVASTYERILRELRLNQVDEQMVERVYKTIAKPLGEVDGDFGKARDQLQAMRKALAEEDKQIAARVKAAEPHLKIAKKSMADAITKLSDILSAMAKLAEINDLIIMLNEIDKLEEDQYRILFEIWKKKYEEELNPGGSK
jgi:hypothetical protein